jgi:hypothetical protein
LILRHFDLTNPANQAAISNTDAWRTGMMPKYTAPPRGRRGSRGLGRSRQIGGRGYLGTQRNHRWSRGARPDQVAIVREAVQYEIDMY